MHAAEQKIECPGCHKAFNRLGGLMGHMELNECTFIPTGFVAELRAKDPHNSGMFDLIRDVASNVQFKSAGPQAVVSQPVNTAHTIVSPEMVLQEAARKLIGPPFIRHKSLTLEL